MAAFRPHRFGRYIIVDPVAVGGMAEIYRARLAGSKEGPDRVIIIKKVIANLSQNTDFIQMFEEEIKITVGLTHPNIIQIYDYGKVDDQYFMAMEYVEGKNLRQFVKRLADMKSMFSIDMSAHIISQVCHALGYAHAFKDRLSGKPLCIVHRDISPQNIMISYDGAVKLFDFGIAKAKSASEATRAGVIKGKPSYLSPEQVNGDELDGRSDIFALGILLWELLTAKRLFVADTDMAVLRLIQNAKIESPSTFNPAVPQALDAIVLKSLSRDKNKRYQNAEEFQRDLHKFLYSFNPSFNPADLSYYAQELFKAEIKEDRQRLHKALSTEPVEATATEDLPVPAKKTKAPSNILAEGLVSSTDFNREMMERVVMDSNTGANDFPSLEIGTKPGLKKTPSTSKTANVPLPPGAKKSASEVIPPWSKNGGQVLPQRRGSMTTGGRTSTSIRTRNNAAPPEEDSTGSKTAFAFLLLIVAGLFGARQMGLLNGTPLDFIAPHVAVERSPASPNNPVVDSGAGNTSPMPQPIEATAPPVAHPPPQAANQGTLFLQSNVEGYSVAVNGSPVKLYGDQFPIPLHTTLSVQVSKPGYETAGFSVTAQDARPISYRVTLKAIPMGMINFVTTPDAKLTFVSETGQATHLLTPLHNQPIPAGKYRVLLENDLIGYRGEMEISVEQNKVVRVEKNLSK
jgi:serine/threonine-protein kinase